MLLVRLICVPFGVPEDSLVNDRSRSGFLHMVPKTYDA